MNRLLVCLILAGIFTAGVAHAQSRESLADAARAFDESALRSDDDDTKPIAVRKWMGPINLGFNKGSRAPGLVEPTRQAIKQIAAEAGVTVVDLPPGDPGAAFVVIFDENESSSGKRNCFAHASWKAWALYKADLKINPAHGSGIDHCIIHEALHAFGFLSHPHDADSVLSYRFQRRALTTLDRHLIHTLYDGRLKPGTPPAAASQLACRILGERLGSQPADIDAVCRGRKGPTPAT